jgi:PTS system mannitol-specific IIA component/phosphocarrier protein FPr
MALPSMSAAAVRLGCTAAGKVDAVEQTGAVLVELGAVEPQYVEAMHERERSMSTYIGEGVAIPHGTDASRVHVRRTELSFIQFPGGVDWNGEQVNICIGIASQGDEHVGVLAALARILVVPEQAEALRNASSPDDVVRLLQAEPEDDEVTQP